MVALYEARFDATPRSCLSCRHSSEDRYVPGSRVCWQDWRPGTRPRRLTSDRPCPLYAARQLPEQRMHQWLTEVHGIAVNGMRWQGHQHDLRREAGTYGFHQGQSYEARVRQWIATQYGADFFLPHRWLCAINRQGGQFFRQVDGIERHDPTTAFVYEIKQHDSGYAQLMEVYLPLLRKAFPSIRFYPLEINKGPVSPWWPTDRPLAILASLEARQPCKAYQYFTLDL
jgi:hypothetical protein